MTPQLLWVVSSSTWLPKEWKSVSWCSVETSHVWFCAHFFLSCHWALTKVACLLRPSIESNIRMIGVGRDPQRTPNPNPLQWIGMSSTSRLPTTPFKLTLNVLTFNIPSSQYPELHHLMVTAFDLHSPKESLPVGVYEVQHRPPFSCCCITWIRMLFLMDSRTSLLLMVWNILVVCFEKTFEKAVATCYWAFVVSANQKKKSQNLFFKMNCTLLFFAF